MARVSHLPHVLANVLVAQAARALESRAAARRPARASATPPAWPAPRRAIWRDIYLSNADALVAAIDDTVRAARRRCATALRRRATRPRSTRWNDAAREDRRRLLEADLAGGEVRRAARLGARTGRASSPRSRSRSGARRSTSSTWRSTRRPTTRRARSRCGSRARTTRAEAEGLIGGARLPGGARRDVLRARRARPARHARRAARQVDLAPRRAAGRDDLRARAGHQLPRRRGHALDAARGAGARRARRARATTRSSIRGAGLRAARAADRRDRRRQRRARCCGCCRAGSRARPTGVWILDGDESIRRRPVDRIAEPLRRMGARLDAREGRFTPLTVAGSAARRDRLRAAGRLGAGQVVRAVRRAARRRRDAASPSRRRAATTPSGCCARPARASSATAPMRDRAPAGRARGRRHRRARRPVLGRVPRRRGDARARLAARARGRRRQLDAHRLPAHRRSGWARSSSARSRSRQDGIPAERAGRRARRPRLGRSAAPSSRPTRCRWRSTSCRSSRCSAASPRARRSCAAPPSCGSRSPTASPPSSTACAASAPSIEATDDGFAVRGTGGLRGGAMDAHGDHRLAMLGAVAGLASREGVEVVGMEAAAVSYPGFTADLERLLSRGLSSSRRQRQRRQLRPRAARRAGRARAVGRASTTRRDRPAQQAVAAAGRRRPSSAAVTGSR